MSSADPTTHWEGCVREHAACLDALVARLRGLLAQATPGPWKACTPPVPESELGEHIAIETLAPCDSEWLSRLVVGVAYYDGPVSAVREEDADLIVAAVNALPQLCDALDALTKELDEVRTDAAMNQSGMEMRLEQATARAEAAERLRAFDTSAVPLLKGLMLEYVRLDEMWQQLVRERDTLQADLARVTAERDEAQRAVRIVTDDWNAIEQAREQAEAQRDAAVAALEEIDGLVTTDSADIARVVGAALDALAAAKED